MNHSKQNDSSPASPDTTRHAVSTEVKNIRARIERRFAPHADNEIMLGLKRIVERHLIEKIGESVD